jgi:hypothetical protein
METGFSWVQLLLDCYTDEAMIDKNTGLRRENNEVIKE